MTRLRFYVILNPSKSEAGDLASYGNVTFTPMDALAEGLGGLDTSLEKPADELAASNYSYFAEGDLLLAKVTPCFENGKKALVSKLPNRIGFATSEVHVVRPNTARVDPNYLRYLFSSETFRAAGMASMTGAGGLRRISDDAIKDFCLPVTELAYQKAIAAFLDRQTARIGLLVEKKARQVELLDQHARQTVSELVSGQASSATEGVETGLAHLPRIAPSWTLRRAGLLFQQVTEPNVDDLPILSVSIHHGISDRQFDDDERDRKVNLIEDRSSYKRVRPGYLAYNMMRAWQGAVGVSTVEGAVSPAYVVARPMRDLHSRYYQFLLRTPPFIEQMRQGSKGITDFRLRLYWEQFRQILLPVPPLDEQRRIAAEAERVLSRAAKLTRAIEASIEKLIERRTALITAAVIGQIDVRAQATPAAKPDRARLRVIVGAEIVHRHQGTPKFGRVKLQKVLYLAEAHAEIGELQGNYVREAAGPLDRALIAETERGMTVSGFFQASTSDGETGNGVTYAPLSKAGQHRSELATLLGPRAESLKRLIDVLRDLDTRAVEAIATLYAVWNDALTDGEPIDDAAIVKGVLTDWHSEKGEKFKNADLHTWLAWMRRHGLVPRGEGPRTSHTMTRDMFA